MLVDVKYLTENNKEDKKSFKKAKIKEKKGLNVAYDKNELGEFFPHLMKELSKKNQSMKINSVNYKIEQKDEDKNQIESIPNELINPGAIDFIRRCTKNEEAFEILDYLLKRSKLTLEEYNMYKKQIMKEGGLKELIEKSGGPKNPGYYINKYYKKDNED